MRSILRTNQVTLSIAAQSIAPLAADLEQLRTGLAQLLEGLTYLQIGAEEVEPGSAEVAVLIPRLAVGNQVERLGREFIEIERLLGPFMELGNGSRSPLTISEISSSDLGIAIDIAPAAAALFAVGAERVLAAYKQILEIRRLRQELSEHGVDEAGLEGVDAHANASMGSAIESATDDLIARSSGIAEYRQNELRLELRASLNSVANRIDRGYNIDVRATEQVPSDEEGGNGSDSGDAGDAAALRLIIETSPGLRFIERTGEPILALPEASVGDEGNPQ